ncbi:MAG: cupin domain-containing protein [Gammaproteobacteria bacterium]|nr:cupin domain-containing protein [Gammaproteobacteria bacterium]
MTQTLPEVRNGTNFTAVSLGEFVGLNSFKFSHPALPFEVEGKVFLNSLLGLTSSEISLNKLPPKASMPFHHKHQLNEEIYIFIKGKGEFQIDDHIFPVSEGTVVRVAPEGVRCWRNLSVEPLYYIVVQAPVGGYKSSGTISDGTAVQKPVRWEPA